MVTDSTNAAIPNAPVKLTHTGTNATTSVMASASGEYSVANLAPGAYFPGYNENVSLAKTFSVKEHFRIDVRAEAFNGFNRVVFGATQTSLNSNTFGVISSQANSQRQMQGGLKLYW
jgi:hypothetical protein